VEAKTNGAALAKKHSIEELSSKRQRAVGQEAKILDAAIAMRSSSDAKQTEDRARETNALLIDGAKELKTGETPDKKVINPRVEAVKTELATTMSELGRVRSERETPY